MNLADIGIQKIDQMKQPIKSKLISGKISLFSAVSQCILTCSIPYYTPNVQFTLKLYESTNSSQQQQQISSYVILSSEYIKQYKTNNTAVFNEEIQMKNDLLLGVDIIVQRSKYLLNAKLKNMENNEKSSQINNNQDEKEKDESRSQTGSVVVNRQGNGYNSATKKLSRTRKNQGKILLRNNSISKQPNQDNQFITSPRVVPFITPRSISQSSNLQQSLTPRSPIIKDNYQQKISPSRSMNFAKSTSFTNNLFPNNNSSIISPTYSKLSKSKHEQTSNINNSEVKKNLTKKIYMKQKQAQLTESITLGIQSKEEIKIEFQEKSEKQSIKSIKKYENIKQLQKSNISNQNIVTVTINTNTKKQYSRPVQYSQNKKEGQIIHKNNTNQLQQKLYYIIFLVLSIFLIYKAMSPTRRA